ncbi:hypothetical protein [Actinoplanes sp. NPDC020271]|uniref:hypothetical protein n=1 Tax=Actinoplanes sp. NPDC020271 TaxID=3363896 RepID=UPI00378A6BC7
MTLRQSLLRTLGSAAVGFAMVLPAAVFLKDLHRQSASGFGGLEAVADMALIWIFVLPPVGWLLLRLVGTRPAWVAALLGPVMLAVVIRLLHQSGGRLWPAGVYGLQGALAYAITAVLVLTPSYLRRTTDG